MFYARKQCSEAPYLKELREFASRSGFKLVEICSCEQHQHGIENGRINSDLLKKTLDSGVQAESYLCGPPEFMNSVTELLKAQGVDKKNIHRESFG